MKFWPVPPSDPPKTRTAGRRFAAGRGEEELARDPVAHRRQLACGDAVAQPAAFQHPDGLLPSTAVDGEADLVGVLELRELGGEDCSAAARGRLHRPEQAHPVDPLVGAGARGRRAEVDGALRIGHEGGVGLPALRPVVRGLAGDGHLRPRRESGDPQADRLVRERVGVVDVDGDGGRVPGRPVRAPATAMRP